MNTQEYTQETEYIKTPDSLALAVVKEHRLMIIRKASRITFRMSWKTMLYMLFLTFTNIVI